MREKPSPELMGWIDGDRVRSGQDKTFVYVIAEKGADRVKIGIAENTKKRLAILQTGNAARLVLHSCFLFQSKDCARIVEQYSHHLMQSFRLVGEWFEIPPDFAAQVVYAGAMNLWIRPTPMKLGWK